MADAYDSSSPRKLTLAGEDSVQTADQMKAMDLGSTLQTEQLEIKNTLEKGIVDKFKLAAQEWKMF